MGESQVQFGILEDKDLYLLSGIDIPEEKESQYFESDDDDLYYRLYGEFTLTSHDNASYVVLFEDFKKWLEAIPKIKVKKDLVDLFKQSLCK